MHLALCIAVGPERRPTSEIGGKTVARSNKQALSNNADLSLLRTNGFTDEQIDRLVVVRERYRRNEYSDETQESKRLLFVKWLCDHGRLDNGEIDELSTLDSVIGGLEGLQDL